MVNKGFKRENFCCGKRDAATKEMDPYLRFMKLPAETIMLNYRKPNIPIENLPPTEQCHAYVVNSVTEWIDGLRANSTSNTLPSADEALEMLGLNPQCRALYENIRPNLIMSSLWIIHRLIERSKKRYEVEMAAEKWRIENAGLGLLIEGGQEAVKQNLKKQMEAERIAAERRRARRKADEWEMAERIKAEREAAKTAAAERKAAKREAAKREAAEREAAEREVFEIDGAELEAERRDQDEWNKSDQSTVSSQQSTVSSQQSIVSSQQLTVPDWETRLRMAKVRVAAKQWVTGTFDEDDLDEDKIKKDAEQRKYALYRYKPKRVLRTGGDREPEDDWHVGKWEPDITFRDDRERDFHRYGNYEDVNESSSFQEHWEQFKTKRATWMYCRYLEHRPHLEKPEYLVKEGFFTPPPDPPRRRRFTFSEGPEKAPRQRRFSLSMVPMW